MRPAFNSPYAAGGFVLLLLILLVTPWLWAKNRLPQTKETYSSESIRFEKFPWVQKFIFEETNDIDIAFIGSSHICFDVDTPYVQQELDRRLGRKTVVRTLGWSFPGFDSVYFFTKDLLEHRKVRTLVFSDECAGPTVYREHSLLPYWYRFGQGDEVLRGLPMDYRATYYFAAVIGMPRILLAGVSPNLHTEDSEELTGPFGNRCSVNPEQQLGCIGARVGFSPQFGAYNPDGYVVFSPKPQATPAELVAYSAATASNFVFSGRPLPESQTYFARQFALLAKAHNCDLVELHLPMLDERNSPAIPETRNWPDVMQSDVSLLGIPGEHLFAGLSENDIKLLFNDPGHLNLNGQKYFTPLITPGLVEHYASLASH